MDNLEKAALQRFIKEQELEQSIKALVKELCRLQGITCYEALEDHTIAENMRDYWKNQQSGNN